MTKSTLDLQTTSTERTDKQDDRILLCSQVTVEKGKADPSHFFKFLFTRSINNTFAFAQQTRQTLAKTKEPFFVKAIMKILM